jgi:hypothetical protein
MAVGCTPAQAWDLLPDPGAAAVLQAQARRAFDRGDFATARTIWDRLAAVGTVVDQPLRLAAARLAGDGAQIDPAVALAEPGGVHPVDLPLFPAIPATRGWLLATDPWGRVRWQRSLADLGRIMAQGEGWALVLGGDGWRAVDPDGAVLPLPPLPEGIGVLGLSGGSAWFWRDPGQRGRGAEVPVNAWGMVLPTGPVVRVELPAPPLGPPLIRAERRLWLLRDRLRLEESGTILSDLPLPWCPGPGARLRAQGPALLVVDGEQAWRVGPAATAPPVAIAGHSELADDLLRPWPMWRHRSVLPPLPAPSQMLPAGLLPPVPALDLPTNLGLERRGGWLTVSASAADGTERWRRRWPALDDHVAPAQWASLVGGTVQVLEGDREATVLDARTGQLLGSGTLPVPVEAVPLAPWGDGGVAGIARERIVFSDGTAALPVQPPLRLFAAAGRGVLVVDAAGARLVPDGGSADWVPDHATPWPGGLLTADGVRLFQPR